MRSSSPHGNRGTCVCQFGLFFFVCHQKSVFSLSFGRVRAWRFAASTYATGNLEVRILRRRVRMLVLVHGLQDSIAEHRHCKHNRNEPPPVGVRCAEATRVVVRQCQNAVRSPYLRFRRHVCATYRWHAPDRVQRRDRFRRVTWDPSPRSCRCSRLEWRDDGTKFAARLGTPS